MDVSQHHETDAPPAPPVDWREGPWEDLPKSAKIKRGFYVAGVMLLKVLKGVVFVIAALFAAVFGLAEKQNRRRK